MGLITRIERLEAALSKIEHSESTIKLLQAQLDAVSKESSALAAQLGGIPQHLQATVGYRVREVFRCDTCGTTGNVAGRIICTKCRRESWWGWWPKKG